MLIFFSCSDNSINDPQVSLNKDAETSRFKVRGDNNFDVLGFAFDATGQYLDQMETLLPVIDVNRLQESQLLVSDNPTRTELDIQSGSDAKSVLLKFNRKFSQGGSIPIEGVPFTASIESEIGLSSKVATKYSYAFANMNVYVSHHAIRPGTEISVLQNYLTPEFQADIQTKTPEQIIAMYGTHVYTDIYTGGSIKFIYKANIKNTTKDGSAAYGAQLKVGAATGTNLSLSSNTSISASLTSDFQLESMSYKSVGGASGMTVFGTWTQTSGVSTPINFNQWSTTVKKSEPNSLQLIDIGEKSLIAIYELVADPAKKAALKTAVDNHILSKSFQVVPVVPLYEYKHKSTSNHFYTTDWGELGGGTSSWNYEGIEAFVCESQLANTVPFYRFYRTYQVFLGKKYYDHYYTTVKSSGEKDYTLERIQCYIYSTNYPQEYGMKKLYQYWNPNLHDHYYSADGTIPSGYGSETLCGYVY